MATSKTLTPTNVTIQIPAFTDKPDQRVNSNCIDKEADAINALSDQIASMLKPKNIGSKSSGTIVLTIPRSSGHIVYFASASNVKCGMVIVAATSSGEVSYYTVSLGANLTISSSTDTLSVAISGTGSTINVIDMPTTISSGYITVS